MGNSTHRRDTLQAIEYRYTMVFEPAEEGGYVVTVPALPGVVTEGDTLEEARAMAKDAIRATSRAFESTMGRSPLSLARTAMCSMLQATPRI